MRLLPVLALACLLPGLPTVAAATRAAAAPVDPCAGWSVSVLATGLGSLENLEPDGQDGLFLSASTAGAILRLSRTSPDAGLSAPTTVVPGVTSPGGLRVRSGALFFTTGDAAASGVLGTKDGTLQRLDLRTGARRTWASGLTMPNGLAFLPDGSAVTSRDVAGLAPTGITRIRREGATPQESWSDQADSNGLAVDSTGRWLYSDETFTATSHVYRTEIARPANRQLVASLAPSPAGVPKGLDDLTLATSGALYLTANASGEVLRLDPRTGRSCTVAAGLTNPSAVKQGSGRVFPSGRLYVSGFDGRVLELTPPRGSRP